MRVLVAITAFAFLSQCHPCSAQTPTAPIVLANHCGSAASPFAQTRAVYYQPVGGHGNLLPPSQRPFAQSLEAAPHVVGLARTATYHSPVAAPLTPSYPPGSAATASGYAGPSPYQPALQSPAPLLLMPYPAAGASGTYYAGRGLIGQPKLYVTGQPLRNALRFLTP